eukprot:CAMPEP_0177676120 /NCGR_PEP_ID=MMETSP0447-20121125/27599_1 /TAXON_ID=0 /ORGANISM="Stygamoeba regulata, Strain BSH-02190019" /LENGTH=413 /DNA_ID=CAMNT_0019184621 /DNA_START=72 /DNA_END=1313 /DNA_ORIENTATION=+
MLTQRVCVRLLHQQSAVSRCLSSLPSRASSAATVNSEALKETPLCEYHEQLGGQMVPYGGWKMPLQYSTASALVSHNHTRQKASLFDVSHMCQAHLLGDNAAEFLEQLVVADLKALPKFTGVLSVLTNEKGGIIDDLIITRHHDRFNLVLNAGCADKDLAHLTERLSQFDGVAVLQPRLDLALLALQGPLASTVLQRFVKEDLRLLRFMECVYSEVAGIPVVVSRTGYTGEDGFELSMKARDALSIATLLMGEQEVEPAGLAARDSLRLEAGLCLYGNDLDETVTPVEAGLRWCIGERRLKEGGFLGYDVIRQQISEGPPRRRVGLVLPSGIARAHAPIFKRGSDQQVGEVTSGGFSPMLKKGVAMGYVTKGNGKLNNELEIEVRNKRLPAVVSRMPFHPTNYYVGEKTVSAE